MTELGSRDQNLGPRYAPLLSRARFGPGSIFMLCSITLLAVLMYFSGHTSLAIASGAASVVLFSVKSMEIIELTHMEDRRLIGRRCLVVKRVTRAQTGVVKVYGRAGRLDPELWSAESEHEISEGKEAEIQAMRSIVLLIKPIED